jgi:hypothetical protein
VATKHERVKERERKRAKRVISQESPSTSLASTSFIGEVGGEVIITSPGGACFLKKATRGYKQDINIIFQALRLCNWALNTIVGSLTYNTTQD